MAEEQPDVALSVPWFDALLDKIRHQQTDEPDDDEPQQCELPDGHMCLNGWHLAEIENPISGQTTAAAYERCPTAIENDRLRIAQHHQELLENVHLEPEDIEARNRLAYKMAKDRIIAEQAVTMVPDIVRRIRQSLQQETDE